MQRWAVIALGLWIGASVALGGLLLAQHLVPLPVPDVADARLRDAVASVGIGATDRWRVAHIMYRSCPCSQRTIAHLQIAPRPADVDELVVMVDDSGAPGLEDRSLRDAGFQVEVITPSVLHDRYGVDAAPLLVIARPDHSLAYVGGYNRHKQSAVYEDLAILDDVRRRSERDALPVFGCPISQKLASELDPLGLRKW